MLKPQVTGKQLRPEWCFFSLKNPHYPYTESWVGDLKGRPGQSSGIGIPVGFPSDSHTYDCHPLPLPHPQKWEQTLDFGFTYSMARCWSQSAQTHVTTAWVYRFLKFIGFIKTNINTIPPKSRKWPIESLGKHHNLPGVLKHFTVDNLLSQGPDARGKKMKKKMLCEMAV